MPCCDNAFRIWSRFVVAGGFQNLFTDGAGVLGIAGNGALPERFPKNDGAAHSLAVFGRDAGSCQNALGNLAQHVGFGEFLGAYDDLRGFPFSEPGFGFCRLVDAKDSEQAQESRAKSPGQPFHESVSLLWALMNSETKPSAGWSRSSAKRPDCTTLPCLSKTSLSPK